MGSPLTIVKAALQAYVDKDRPRMESLIADNYHFSSPLDNCIDRKTYFDRCWPNSEKMAAVEFINGAENGDTAWVIYEARHGGKRFRNVEMHRVKDGKLIETEVYFGWDLPHKATKGGFVNNV